MRYTFSRTGDVWTVIDSTTGESVFSGDWATARQRLAELNLAAMVSLPRDNKANRREAAQRARGGWGFTRRSRR